MVTHQTGTPYIRQRIFAGPQRDELASQRRKRRAFAYSGMTPLPSGAAVTVPAKPVFLSDAFFAETLCRNCGAVLQGPH